MTTASGARGSWVKEGILAAFRFGVLAEFASGALCFIDKDTISPRRFKIPDGVRIVPGGTSIRRGAHVAKGVGGDAAPPSSTSAPSSMKTR